MIRHAASGPAGRRSTDERKAACYHDHGVGLERLDAQVSAGLDVGAVGDMRIHRVGDGVDRHRTAQRETHIAAAHTQRHGNQRGIGGRQ